MIDPERDYWIEERIGIMLEDPSMTEAEARRIAEELWARWTTCPTQN